MARIPLVEPENASAEVRAIYDEIASWGLPVVNVVKLFANDAFVLRGFAEMIRALYVTPHLAPRHRELAYLRASQLNGCHY